MSLLSAHVALDSIINFTMNKKDRIISIRSYPECGPTPAAIKLGLRIAEATTVYLYGMLLVPRYSKAECAIARVASAISSNIVTIHINRVSSYRVGCDGYLGVASWGWRVRGWWIRRRRGWSRSGRAIDVNVNVIAPAVAIVL